MDVLEARPDRSGRPAEGGVQWLARSSAHRLLHQRADPRLVGGGQLRPREGGRPRGAVVERGLHDIVGDRATARIDALGGPRMRDAGARVTYPMERLSAFGFVEAVEKIPRHVRLLRDLDRAFAERRYDLAIVIELPTSAIANPATGGRFGVWATTSRPRS